MASPSKQNTAKASANNDLSEAMILDGRFHQLLSSETIQTLLRRNPGMEVYLDALPDLLKRGVKAVQIAGGEVVGEVFSSDPGKMYKELSADIIAKHGKAFQQNQPAPTLQRDVNPLDLIIFFHYYCPERK
jgi:hypothetical protein